MEISMVWPGAVCQRSNVVIDDDDIAMTGAAVDAIVCAIVSLI